MRLTLQQLTPEHLEERLKSHNSQLWGKDLVFQAGERVFIQAPSGTGKTTLIHILYGLRTDYRGKVLWEKLDPANTDDSSLSSLRTNNLSIIFQDMRLFPTLTAIENIEVKRVLTGTTTKDLVDSWIDALGMSHKKNALASTLSYGEQQRVSIIRALVQPCDWLLMDEPFSHLDTDNRQKAIELISKVVTDKQAGMILADLDANNYFPYTQTFLM